MPRIRARDLSPLIKEHGFERAMVMAMTHSLEEQAEFRQHLQELVSMSARCVDELEKLIHVSGGLRDKLEELRRIPQQGDEHGEAS